MPDVSGDVAMRRERILASTRLKQSVIKHLSLEIISRHSLEGNLRYEKLWRARIGELVHDMMHNSIWSHQLEHHEEPVVDYENKVIPIVQKQFKTYNNFLETMINRKVCVDGVITPQISKAIDNKLVAVSSLLDNYAAALVAESAKKTNSKRLDFPTTSFKDIVCTNFYNKGRV
jgi:hypothetical protein